MFRKILVPYDGSIQAENALKKAIYLAKLISGSKVFIVTVTEEIKTSSILFGTKVHNYKTGKATTLSNYIRDLQKDMRDKKIVRLNELKRKYQNSVQIRTLVSVGHPEVKIVEHANDQHVDLIVMGSRA